MVFQGFSWGFPMVYWVYNLQCPPGTRGPAWRGVSRAFLIRMNFTTASGSLGLRSGCCVASTPAQHLSSSWKKAPSGYRQIDRQIDRQINRQRCQYMDDRYGYRDIDIDYDRCSYLFSYFVKLGSRFEHMIALVYVYQVL